MSNIIGLHLDQLVCPDGYVLGSYTLKGFGQEFGPPLPGERAIPASEAVRMVAISGDLAEPVVIRFINADTWEKQKAFFRRYGLPVHTPPTLAEIEDYRRKLAEVLAAIEARNQAESMGLINNVLRFNLWGNQANIISASIVEDERNFAVTTRVELAGKKPRVAIVARTLLAFMGQELALITASGARPKRCERCDDWFLTGHRSGNTAKRKWCSDRCRVAAARQLKAESA